MQQEDRGGLQLGIFMPNCSNMQAISTYRSGPDEWSYESNERIALPLNLYGLAAQGGAVTRFGHGDRP